MRAYRYFLTYHLAIVLLSNPTMLLGQKEIGRNPFNYVSKTLRYPCLATGKIEGTQEKLAVIAINKTFLTVRVGDICHGKKVIKITDHEVILADKQSDH